MANKRTYSTAFKRQVVQEYLAGVKLYSLARRHGLSVTEIRRWADQYLYPSQGSHRCEAGACERNAEAATTARDYEAAAVERLIGSTRTATTRGPRLMAERRFDRPPPREPSGRHTATDHLGGHGPAKYPTGTRLGTSEGRGWRGLLAERWTNPEGELGETLVTDTEVIVLLEGRLPIRRRGDGQVQHCTAVPGTIWICPAGVYEDMIHLYGKVRESLHLFLPALPFSGTALREMNVDPARISLNYEGGFRDPLIEQIARSVHAEMLDPAPAGKMLVETLASALGVHLLQNHSNLESASVALPAARGALDSRRLQRVKEFIEIHLDRDLTVETLANEACLSPFHFARAFKAATGVAPHRYVTDRRLEAARAWVAEGVPFAEIAFRCGFSSQAYFTKWFRRLVGATPTEYRTSYS